MFPFDAASLPQLTTRKALIAVDFQNDFVGAQHGDDRAALPVVEPKGFVARAVALSEAFRDGVGDVVWVQSCFDQARPADQEPIITSDTAPPPPRPYASSTGDGSRRRGKQSETLRPADESSSPDAEAFLSHEEPACVRSASAGAEIAPAVKIAIRAGDTVLTKTHYSAFLGTPLLRLLRAKMVMEFFICGSLANVGVYATALDAAGHGMTITIVEDCCGYRVEPRQVKAVRSLIELTGCEVASCQEVLESIQPRKRRPVAARDSTKLSKSQQLQEDNEEGTKKTKQESRAHQAGEAEPQRRAANSPDIVTSMTELKLVSDSEGIEESTAETVEPDTASKYLRSTGAKCGAPVNSNTRRDDDDDDDDDDKRDDANEGGESRAGSAVSFVDLSPDLLRDQAEGASQLLTQPPAIKTMPAVNHAAPAGRRAEAGDSRATPPSDTDGEEEQNQPRATTGLCEGDTSVITNLLPPSVEAGIFDRLRDEVQWQRMSHQGGEVPRLVAVQGAVSPDDGSAPVYRHPSDESPPLRPFSPTVLVVRAAVEEQLGHPVNHVLVQFYRDGSDCISEHSDKTLDIARDSYIANVSLGAERTMSFRTKRPARIPSSRADGDWNGVPSSPAAASSRRQVQRATLPHNSLCKMGLATNMKWLHAIRADRRADREKTVAELAYGGARLSLTFRRIATYLDRDHAVIWGQGATSETRDGARPVINGQGPEAVAMLRAFGAENHASDFDWETHYGNGFGVLHIRTAPRFFASAEDVVANTRVALMLAEYGIGYARGTMGPAQITESAAAHGDVDESPQQPLATVKFVDDDASRTVVQGDVAIMLYLDSCHGRTSTANAAAPSRAELAARFTRFQRALHLRDMLRGSAAPAQKLELSRPLRRELAAWDALAYEARDGAGFIAGPSLCLADFALWPVLHALVEERGAAAVFGGGLDRLRSYYHAVAARESVRKALGAMPRARPRSP